jgi:CubicO group peptidase (beta-lactamase class C family)
MQRALISLEDMIAFDRALREHRLVAEDTHRLMRTPQRLASGRDEGYGLGWVLTEYRGTPVAGHTGGIDGFFSFYARFPEADASIILLTNCDGFPTTRLARRIADEALDLPDHPDEEVVAEPPPPDLAGTYRGAVEAGRLLLDLWGETHRMLPLGAGRYRAEDDPGIGPRVHDAGAITVDYPFTWFTGCR